MSHSGVDVNRLAQPQVLRIRQQLRNHVVATDCMIRGEGGRMIVTSRKPWVGEGLQIPQVDVGVYDCGLTMAHAAPRGAEPIGAACVSDEPLGAAPISTLRPDSLEAYTASTISRLRSAFTPSIVGSPRCSIASASSDIGPAKASGIQHWSAHRRVGSDAPGG